MLMSFLKLSRIECTWAYGAAAVTVVILAMFLSIETYKVPKGIIKLEFILCIQNTKYYSYSH